VVPLRKLAAAAVLVTLTAGGLTACGDDSDDSASSGGLEAQPTAGDFPPNDVDELAAIYDELLAEFDVRLTRGEVIDRTDGQYEPSPTGTHLALYVEPLSGSTDEVYLDQLVEITRIVTPQVFEEWGSIVSYDICQEPTTADDDSEEPVPVTQVEITRTAAADIDFAALDLAELLAIANLQDNPPVRVYADPVLKQLPAWQDAADEAVTIREDRGLESPVPPGA
jgi:hypothetical protein